MDKPLKKKSPGKRKTILDFKVKRMNLLLLTKREGD
jgi:hypothetical protein